MRVINPTVANVSKAYTQQKLEKAAAPKEERLKKDDQISLSPEARFFNIAKAALKEFPVEDEHQLAELRASINNGTYEIKNDELVEKVWEESFLNQRI